MQPAKDHFHSKFGGMWIDTPDAESEIAARVQRSAITQDIADKLKDFIRDGYVILPGAVPEGDIQRFEQEISSAFRDGHKTMLCQNPGEQARRPVVAGMPRHGTRIVDAFVPSPPALDLLSAPAIANFLKIIFDETPLLFQSLSFDTGSGQGLHQDTAYVVVDRPLELAACWIALEDVREGSGELQYMIGSHRLPDYDFGGNKKHWNPESDGSEVHEQWSRWIHLEGEQRDYPVKKFMAKRGDVLIWHGDLAHGGSPISDATLTRKSLVGH